MSTYTELMELAEQIRTNATESSNTAELVGGTIKATLQFLRENLVKEQIPAELANAIEAFNSVSEAKADELLAAITAAGQAIVTDLLVPPEVQIDWTLGAYYNLNKNVGDIISATSKPHTSINCAYIKVTEGETYTLSGYVGDSREARVYALTDNSFRLLAVAEQGEDVVDKVLEITESGYMFLDIKKTVFASFSISVQRDLTTSIQNICREVYEDENSSADIPCSNTLIQDGGSLAIFKSIGVIGDSFSAGTTVYYEQADEQSSQEQSSYHEYDISWPAFLQLKTGRPVYNFSKGGQAARDFLSNAASTAANNEHPHMFNDADKVCQAYFIALTHNDKNYCKRNWQAQGYSSEDAMVEAYVGSEDDIDFEDKANNASTFYGYYAKIIQSIKEKAPHAKIFTVVSKLESTYPLFNKAIRRMAALFTNIYTVDMPEYFPGNPSGTWHYTNGHGNAMGYREYCDEVSTVADWIIRHNRSKFKYTAMINGPYDSSIPSSQDASVPSVRYDPDDY